MTYMYEVSVKKLFIWNGVKLPEGLTVRVAYDSLVNPLCTPKGKDVIATAFKSQCGLDLSKCMNAISTVHMDAKKM